jgi:hypothetical protein
MAFKNTNLSVLAYNTGYILRRNALISRILSQSSGTRFTPGNGYTYEIFINPGTFTVHTGGYMDVMVVAGGGGGGAGEPFSPNRFGGGGGAGGMLHEYNKLFPQGIYTVNIGAGGVGGVYNLSITNDPASAGANGQPSHITGSVGFSSITAIGGGGGGSANDTNPPGAVGKPGGSGGGAGSSPGGFSYFGDGIPGQGYPGGQGRSVPAFIGGGGGGAGQAGFTAPYPGGSGGIGAAAFNGDTGVPPAYGTPSTGTWSAPPTSERYFAGGGGGGNTPSNDAAGGGGLPFTSGNQVGQLNTGGGGGGGPGTGYNGGPGIVIVRYLTNAP